MVEINNLTSNPADEGFLRRVAENVLKGEKKEKLEVSIVLVGPGRIRELNKKYRRKNKITDVLSFPYDNSGEIVICLRQVLKNAKRLGLAPDKELARVLIHGILHLTGYDHEKSEKEAEEMRKREEDYLRQFKC